MDSKSTEAFFMRFLEPKNKMKNQGIGKYQGKYREKLEKRNFGGDILSISTDNRYFGRNIENFVPSIEQHIVFIYSSIMHTCKYLTNFHNQSVQINM